jgi:hypothetical protein
MATTFTLIASVTVGSGGAASIDFSSIPSTYTDLCLKISARNVSGAQVFDYLKIGFNGSVADYTLRTLEGDGSSAASYTRSTFGVNFAGRFNGAGSTSNTFGNAEMYFPNYAGSTNKSMSVDTVTENNGTTAYATLLAGLWSQTAAITSISFTTEISNFAQHSTATLYGIKNS